MAVQNYYVNPLISGNQITKSLRAFQGNGGDGGNAIAIVNILASDNNGSIYRLWKNIDSRITIIGLNVFNSALTSGTSYGLSLYQPNLSTVLANGLSASYFSGVMSLVTAHGTSPLFGGTLDGLAGLAIATAGPSGQAGTVWTNRLFEHAGYLIQAQPSPPDAFDICLTATTASTVAGTVIVSMQYVID
jgi:hypothetical protein